MVGYNDKMSTLLATVIGKIAEFEVKSDRYSVIKVNGISRLQIVRHLYIAIYMPLSLYNFLDAVRAGNGCIFKHNFKYPIHFQINLIQFAPNSNLIK